MRKILITGATGFVGTHLVHEALRRGYEVYAAVRKSSKVVDLERPGVHIVLLDFSNEDSMQKTLMSLPVFTYIIHNAGLTKAAKQEEYDEVNAYNTQRFINAVIKAESCAVKFLFTSSLAAYGPGDSVSLAAVKLDDIPRPITFYGNSKLLAEKYLLNQHELPYIILRPTAVYGPGEKDLFQFISLINKRLELYMGAEQQILTFVYVKDLVRLMLDALESPQRNTSYFVADGNCYTNKQLANILKAKLQKRTVCVKVPIFIVRIVAWFSECLAKATGRVTILNKNKINELTAKNWRCDTSNIYNDLKFEFEYDLEKGMNETIAWYKEHKWL